MKKSTLPLVKVKKTVVVKKAKAPTSVKSPVKEEKKAPIHSMSVTVLGADGESKGKTALPPEIFGAKVHENILAQSVRVYLANQRTGGAHTKTRGEVEGSTRKIYRQKGTGKARHGGIRAPIFVGGGIVFGPRPHEYRLHMPKKMRKVALSSALSYQMNEGNIVVIDGLDHIEPKTKLMLSAFSVNKLDTDKLLLVLSSQTQNVRRALGNVASITLRPATSLNAYDILWHKTIVFVKDALPIVKETYISQ